MIRIWSERSDGETSLRVEGRLIGDWVEELGKACEPFLTSGLALRLDLSELSFASREGVALIHALAERGVRIAGSSRFVATLLQEGNHGAAGTQLR